MADANVRVLVSAITEAAEQSLEDVGDEMGNLSADGHLAAEGIDAASDEMSQATRASLILQSALDEVGDEALSTAAQAEILQSALDEVGDEAVDAAAGSAAASGAFSALTVSSDGAAVSVGTLSTAFTLSLIPAVLTLATVLAPVVAMLGALAAGAAALAGAFGLILGSGILAFGEQRAKQNEEQLRQTERKIEQLEELRQSQGRLTSQQQERLQTLRQEKKELEEGTTATGALAGVMGELGEEIKPLIVDFGREFVPLIKEAVDAIPDVVEEMLNAVGGTSEFKDALRDFGAIAADVLPAFVGLMFDLARAALPVAREFFDFLLENGDEALSAIHESVTELAPEFYDLLDALIAMAPELLEFGTEIAELVIPAVTKLTEAITTLMEWFNDLHPVLQDIIGSLLILGPVLVWLAGKFNLVKGAIMAKDGLLWAARGLAGALAGGGAATTASIYGAAIVAGAGIGLLAVKLLELAGAFEHVKNAGRGFREMIGGQQADNWLTQANAQTLGGFERFAEFGAGVRGFLDPNSDIDSYVSDVDETFDRAGKNAATEENLYPTDEDQVRSFGDDSQGNNVQDLHNQAMQNINNTEVNVDVAGDLESDPYNFSRDVADQVNREMRNQSGT